MKVIQLDLNKDYSHAIAEVISVLKGGGVIIYPTDTLYGIGGNALDPKAVEKVYRIKDRPLSKPVPIIIKNLIWAEELAYITNRHKEILQRIWPGKVTAVLPKKPIIPSVTTANSQSIAMRIPDYTFLDQLLGKYGYPLVGTSANLSGEESKQDIDKIVQNFKDAKYRPDLVIDVGILPPSSPSTIIDLTSDKPKVLRVGPSKPDQLLKLLEV